VTEAARTVSPTAGQLYERVRGLPLVIERYDLEGHEYVIGPEFTRKTTVIRLEGAGEEGLGEDVTYDAPEHDAQQARGPVLPFAGEWTLDSFSQHLETQPLFAREPERHAYLDYRRWAFESAALDLALRQAGVSLGDAVGREPQPVTFVSSGGLGAPPSTERLRAFLALYPTLRFKLDARPDWTDEIFDELRDLGCVDSIDLKGQYSGTVVDNPPDPELYRRVLEAFPEAWIEDPALTPETEALLEPHADRVTWDAVIHSVADIEALRWPPRMVNIKPSRFGTIARLFAAYDYCDERGIGAYGGGQWELSIGRGHIQLLAALFHPDTPNDVAPGGYNAAEPVEGLPTSPLTLPPRATGFLAR
jgi:L-alanine-DL-glutamate epimerase-like enolase superfamily enzyme